MATGTFTKTGAGTIEDPKDHPNWWSGPDAIGANEVAILKRRISMTDTHVEVEYTKRTLTDRDNALLIKRVKGSALFDDAKWDAFSGAEKADFVRTVCQNLVKKFLGGTPQ